MDYDKQMKMLFVGTIILSISLITMNALESADFPLPQFIIEYEIEKSQNTAGKIQEYEMKQNIKDGKININTANVEELDLLPGVGETTANVIINFREEYGPFKTINNLLDVPGIGEKTLDKLRPFITVGDKDPLEIIKENL